MSLARGTDQALGVDGCPGAWLGALVATDGQVTWRLFESSRRGVHAMLSIRAAATGVDIPIGLPESGPRECDRTARRLLGPRRSTVFPAPPRCVLRASSYEDACARARQASGTAISRQAWNITARIADIDGALTPPLQARVVEVHPEVSYALLAGAPLPPKRSKEGLAGRVRALSTWLPDPEAALAAAPRPARADDAADALAAAWSAWRWVRGDARIVPYDPPRDARGLRMEIVG